MQHIRKALERARKERDAAKGPESPAGENQARPLAEDRVEPRLVHAREEELEKSSAAPQEPERESPAPLAEVPSHPLASSDASSEAVAAPASRSTTHLEPRSEQAPPPSVPEEPGPYQTTETDEIPATPRREPVEQPPLAASRTPSELREPSTQDLQLQAEELPAEEGGSFFAGMGKFVLGGMAAGVLVAGAVLAVGYLGGEFDIANPGLFSRGEDQVTAVSSESDSRTESVAQPEPAIVSGSEPTSPDPLSSAEQTSGTDDQQAAVVAEPVAETTQPAAAVIPEAQPATGSSALADAAGEQAPLPSAPEADLAPAASEVSDSGAEPTPAPGTPSEVAAIEPGEDLSPPATVEMGNVVSSVAEPGAAAESPVNPSMVQEAPSQASSLPQSAVGESVGEVEVADVAAPADPARGEPPAAAEARPAPTERAVVQAAEQTDAAAAPESALAEALVDPGASPQATQVATGGEVDQGVRGSQSDPSAQQADGLDALDQALSPLPQYRTTVVLNFRRSPDLSGALIGQLPPGTAFQALERSEAWLMARIDGEQGWLHSDYAEVIEAPLNAGPQRERVAGMDERAGTPERPVAAAQKRPDSQVEAIGDPGTPAPSTQVATRGAVVVPPVTTQRAQRSAPKPQPAPGNEPSLATYTRIHAERELLALWNLNHEPSGAGFCSDVARYNLECVNAGGGLSGLLRFNRPAILNINVTGVPAYALATKISDDSVVLDVLGRKHTIRAETLNQIWDGNFVMLWRRPAQVPDDVLAGTQGPAVQWLRNAIDQIEGDATLGDTYDEQLAARVKRLQREAGLSPDGIVGSQTLIVIQNRLAELKSGKAPKS